MSIVNDITAIPGLANKPIVERAVKTFVETAAAQAALYTTVVPNTPGVKTSAAIAGGAALLSVLWNGLLLWATSVKSKRLDKLAAVIDAAVDARLAEQAAIQVQTPVSQRHAD